MAKQDDYQRTALRLPKGLHSKILGSAEDRGCSMNAEIIQRLEQSFEGRTISTSDMTSTDAIALMTVLKDKLDIALTQPIPVYVPDKKD